VRNTPETRAAYVANMAPKDFTAETWTHSLIREILCRFGDSEKVQTAVSVNFGNAAWTGPTSSYYATQKQVLLGLKSVETDPNALRWLTNEIDVIERSLQAANIEEEARCY
jgi:hypothetical protein